MRNPDAIRRFNENHMYKDSASIFRYVETEHSDGSTTHVLKNVPELSGLPCLMSIESSDDPQLSSNINPINLLYTLFTSDLNDIKSGDFIRVLRHGRAFRCVAGDPVLYECHQEIPIYAKEWS